MSSDLHPLTSEQRAVLEFLLAADFEGRDELLAQAQTVQTGGLTCHCGCPSFSLKPDRPLPVAAVRDTVPIEAHGRAPEGTLVGVLLFVRGGYLDELEVFGWAETPPPDLPEPRALAISQWSEPGPGCGRTLLNP